MGIWTYRAIFFWHVTNICFGANLPVQESMFIILVCYGILKAYLQNRRKKVRYGCVSLL